MESNSFVLFFFNLIEGEKSQSLRGFRIAGPRSFMYIFFNWVWVKVHVGFILLSLFDFTD